MHLRDQGMFSIYGGRRGVPDQDHRCLIAAALLDANALQIDQYLSTSRHGLFRKPGSEINMLASGEKAGLHHASMIVIARIT